MTIRAVIFGLLLGLSISGFAYFNDSIVRGSRLISHFFPLGVFGVMAVLLFLINPLLRAVSSRAPLRGSEVAVLTAVGLAACAWPGLNFYQVAITNLAMPAHLQKTRTNWQSQHVMSYVPLGDAALAQGHVVDWHEVSRRLVAAADTDAASPAAHVWKLLEPRYRQTFRRALRIQGKPDPATISRLTEALNGVLSSPDFYDPAAFRDVELNETARRLLEDAPGGLETRELGRLNRALLVSAMPDLVLPAPRGGGLLLTTDPGASFALDTLLEGRTENKKLSLWELPWSAWWPTIRLWGGMALLLGVASLCLAVVVHPQWSQRELLSYPIARFVEEVTARKEGRWLPDVTGSRLFWIALVLVSVFHLYNGCAAWFHAVPSFPASWSFSPLRELFPTAARVPHSWGVWVVRLSPTVIGLSFFFESRVIFSLGIANLCWVIFGSLLLANGVPISYVYLGAEKINLLRFGSYVGMALMMCYTGRRYYGNLLASSVGFRRLTETPGYAVLACRGLLVSTALAVLLLTTAGLNVLWSTLCVLLILLTFVIISRIVAETGAFFLQAYWLPVAVLTALFGIEAIGPTGYIVLALASTMLIGDPRATLMPFLTNGLRISDTIAEASPRRIAPWLLVMIVAGFVVAGCVTMAPRYNRGVNYGDGWQTVALPAMPFKHLSNHTSELAAKGVLNDVTARRGFIESLKAFSPAEGAYIWTGIGLAAVLLTAFARLRLPWWPIHPVLFLVWATYPIQQLGGAFLIGWIVKASIVKTMGARGYHSTKPLMIGLIAGDLLGGMFWIVVGLVYYFTTGQTPARYTILSGLY